MIVRDEHKDFLAVDLIDHIDEEGITQNDLGQMQTYLIKKRKRLIQPYKDFQRSSAAKNAWRQGRYKYLKGIRQFARSIAGKRFHRRLGQFLARNSMYYGTKTESLDRYEIVELLTQLNSYKTHLYIEMQYYSPLSEEISFFLASEEILEFLDELTNDIFNHISSYKDFDLTHEIFDGIIRILDFDGLMNTLSRMSKKEIDEVEIAWKKAEKSIYESSNLKEVDNGFYSEVLGVTCKLLGITEESDEIVDEDEE
jgi:hypothetical protein